MPWLSPRFKHHFRHTFELTLLAAFLLGAAVSLTYLEDWCHAHHRPDWLCTGFQVLSIILFVADAVAVAGACVKLVFEVIREIFQ